MSGATTKTTDIDEWRGTLGSRILSMVTARLLAVAEGEGLNGDELLKQADLSRERLEDPDRYLPIERHVALGDAISAGLGPVNGGLHSGMAIFGDPRGGLGYAIRRSGTHARALRRFCGFLAVANQSLRTRLSGDEGQSLKLELDLAQGLKRQGHPAEALFAAWVAMSRFVTNHDWTPSAVTFTHEPRGPISEHAEFFRCSVEFRAPATALWIGADALGAPIAPTEHSLDAVFDRLEPQLEPFHPKAAVEKLMSALRQGGVEAPAPMAPELRQRAAQLLCGADFGLPRFEVAYLLGYPNVDTLHEALA